MPNYSHGTKLTLASIEEPPYLTIGTDVSAKYKGAFCEAKIIDVNKHVKLRVLFDGSSGSYLIDDTEIKTNTTLLTGTKIEARHPEKKQQTYVQATITKILDHSRYTVVFDDGDQCILRRNSLCLKSGKHFAESETLDQLPLTNPEHFGNPVKVGAAEQLNNTNHSNVNQNHAPNNTTNTTATKTQNNQAKSQNNHLLLNDTKPIKVKSSGKRRESVNNGSKNAMDMDDNSVDSSIDSGDANSSETNVKYELIDVGVKLMVQYGKGKIQNFYEAKVNKIETNNAGKIRYFVHYTGWNNRYDEWITKSRIHSIVVDKENGSRDRRSKHPEPMVANSITTPVSSSTTSITPKVELKEKEKEREKEDKVKEKDKDKEKEKEKDKDKDKEKEREKEKVKVKEKEKEKDKVKEKLKVKEKEKEKDKFREKEKDVPPTRTRRARQSEAPIDIPITTSSPRDVQPSNISADTNSIIPTSSTTSVLNSTATTTPETTRSVATPPTTATPVIAVQVIAQSSTTLTPAAQTATAASSSTTTTATTTATTTPILDSTNCISTPSAVSPPTQAVTCDPAPTPKTESNKKEKEVPLRTRRARHVDTSNNTPIISNSTQIAPTSTNYVDVNSTIFAPTTLPVSTAPTTLSVTTNSVTLPVSNTSATIVPLATTPVMTTPVQTIPVIETLSTTSIPLAHTTAPTATTITSTTTTVIDSIQDVMTLATVVSPTIQEVSIEKVEELRPNDPPATSNSKPTYRFCDDIDESDCDKKISILQERILALRQTYTTLKTELNDLDRRKKRPRTERSNSDHISNCSVVCRS